MIAAVGEGWCFLIDGFSYIAVIISLLRMVIPRQAAPTKQRASAVEQFKEGFGYAFGFPPIRSIILLLALVSLVGVPYGVLMPVFAGEPPSRWVYRNESWNRSALLTITSATVVLLPGS